MNAILKEDDAAAKCGKTNGPCLAKSGNQSADRAEIESEEGNACVLAQAWPAQVSRRRRVNAETGTDGTGANPAP